VLLWRYLTEPAWDRLITDPRVPVTRIAGFDDAFECAVPAFVEGHRTQFKDAQSLLKAAALERRKFASCWFAHEHESIAMWDLYVGRRNAGVAIAVLYAELQSLVPRGGLLGPVQYVRSDDASATVPLDRPDLWPFYKLWGYNHEREVRLVVPDDPAVVDIDFPEERWAHVRDTDLLCIVRMARVFSARKSAADVLGERVAAAAPGVDVGRTRAFPKLYRRGEDDWWIEGMEPRPRWELRMLG
jgi:hypothetical protein